MQGIITKKIPATNTRGSRIKASSASGLSVTIPYPHEYDDEGAHRTAAIALVKKLKWDDPRSQRRVIGLLSGSTKDGYCHVVVYNETLPRLNRGDYAYSDPDRRN